MSPSSPLPPHKVVFVTGLSGAGRSAALKILEDLGYEAIDNLPLSLLPALCDQIPTWQPQHPLAIGIDARSHDFDLNRFWGDLECLSFNPSLTTRLLFLDCDDEILLRRYTETRRRHPLMATADAMTLAEAISRERHLMDPLKIRAHLVIDTSQLTLPIFRQMIQHHFSLDASPALHIHLMSFSYRRGIPRESDMVFDARFLSNPYYDPAFRPLTGKDEAVGIFLKEDPQWKIVFDSIQSIIFHSLIGFRQTGRSYLTIACGCTGGQHRSVFLAEQLLKWLHSAGEFVMIDHRDIPLSIERMEI